MGLSQPGPSHPFVLPELLPDDLPPHHMLGHQGKRETIYFFLDEIQLETTQPLVVPFVPRQQIRGSGHS